MNVVTVLSLTKFSTEIEGLKKGWEAPTEAKASEQQPGSRPVWMLPIQQHWLALQLGEMLEIPKLSTSPGKYMQMRTGSAWQLDKS